MLPDFEIRNAQHVCHMEGVLLKAPKAHQIIWWLGFGKADIEGSIPYHGEHLSVGWLVDLERAHGKLGQDCVLVSRFCEVGNTLRHRDTVLGQ